MHHSNTITSPHQFNQHQNHGLLTVFLCLRLFRSVVLLVSVLVMFFLFRVFLMPGSNLFHNLSVSSFSDFLFISPISVLLKNSSSSFSSRVRLSRQVSCQFPSANHLISYDIKPAIVWQVKRKLSWPWCWLYTEMVYPSADSYPSE